MTDNFWKLTTFAAVGLCAILLWLFFSGRGLYDFFLPRGNVIKTAQTVLFRIERESKLVSTSAFVQAVVRQRDEQWYGNAEVIRIVPGVIHYGIDLSAIDKNKIEFDSVRKELYVPLPDVTVQSIDPDLSKAEIIRNLDMLRTEAGTGNILEETTERMIRPAFEELGNSLDLKRVAGEQAIVAVKQLLESSLRAAGLEIQVRPYFKSAGKPAIT